jgi:hypothetical protein
MHTQRASFSNQRGVGRSDSEPQEIQLEDDASASTYRAGFGEELPVAVYRSVLLSFAAVLAVAWLTFGSATATDLDLMVVTALSAIFLLLPIILHRVAHAHAEQLQPDLKRFFASGFETATGVLSAREAWLQIALIPVGLAAAAVLICLVYALTA